ncbi:hypothetical protein E1B28_012496 [Marasmius oreades]|uniref:Uncharacterized protein n=1 Tax=Marasmius oreades TaxID=181124 RepID=A0A9P7RRV2_9AGAR|nr:uncharacterized protein E1B28_012496 [Marasmius oreades]KAG7088512.1 hypothetical protein E1B28_012496 [Marasmius oreades]
MLSRTHLKSRICPDKLRDSVVGFLGNAAQNGLGNPAETWTFIDVLSQVHRYTTISSLGSQLSIADRGSA